MTDVVRIRAGNPSPLTLDGTNTYVIGRDPCWVLDPGPVLEEHLEAVAAEAARRGGAAGLLLTHSHADHSAAVEPLGELLGAALVAPPDAPLQAVPTPGHSPDHVAYVTGDGQCFTGDAVLGAGSVFVAPEPDALRAYLASLRVLRGMGLSRLWPGHGPPVEDPDAKLDAYVEHRLERERRLLAALADGLRDADELLDRVWDDVPAALRIPAGVTLTSHLHKLREDGVLPDDVVWPDLTALRALWLDSQP